MQQDEGDVIESTNLGYPRIGAHRELKRALEGYWRGKRSRAELLATSRTIREQNWKIQQSAGIDQIPSNDFSLYDHVLDTAAMAGAVPSRFHRDGETVGLDTYFAMARGQRQTSIGRTVPAMEMTKWFNTNYHYIVPEFEADQSFRVASTKPVDEYREARRLGIDTRPVLLGPVSFLLLGKAVENDFHPIALLNKLLPVYREMLQQLANAGASWVQMDEPCLVQDLSDRERAAYPEAYESLARADHLPALLLTTYFGSLRENLSIALELPVQGFHLDVQTAPEELDRVVEGLPADTKLSLGLIDGRNVWRADLHEKISLAERAVHGLGPDRVMVGPSSSLLFVPVDKDQEPALDRELLGWLSFARQKLEEIRLITRAISGETQEIRELLEANAAAVEGRRSSDRIHRERVNNRLGNITEDMYHRDSPYSQRRSVQQEALNLPPLPTTSIGSLPQTREVRKHRADLKKGRISAQEYETFMQEHIRNAIEFQEDIGMDVLVHGEFERSDMVEYFGQQMDGIATTKNSWVQSYGSRYVRPPILYGDIDRPEPMTVRWSRFAQSLTDKPVKGMVTGPVTILQWSFVRDDQPRSVTCKQLALAIRDEVTDLEDAGIGIIQIDEPALREGLPLRHTDRTEYLDWAINCFRLASSGVQDSTQIHTHMCYAEFNDIIDAIAEMDADIISIESSRSRMELLDAFVDFQYPNEIGPGVYDIHSPRIVETEEVETLLRKALDVLSPEQLWVNPDCGLKTRQWAEIEPSLKHMVDAARTVRAELRENPEQ